MNRPALLSRMFVAALAVLGTTAATSFADGEPVCPAEVRGVRVQMKNVAGGIGLTFTPPRAAQLAPLRVLIREAAALLEEQTKLAALHPEVMTTSTGAGGVPALDITVRDVRDAVFVIVRPDAENDLDALRARSKSFERYWAEHECVVVPRSTPRVSRAAQRR